MYRIVHETVDGLDKIKLINSFSGEYLAVVPAYGGNINALALKRNKMLHELIAGDDGLATLSGSSANAYRGAKLSPFPNRVNHGVYVFQGKKYFLDRRDDQHALHGLLWNYPLHVKEELIDHDGALLVLGQEYKKEFHGFPFEYRIEIEYRLDYDGFSCITRIFNTSLKAIPMGDGWHPYLKLGSSIDSLLLQIPSHHQLEIDHTMIPTGKYIKNFTFRLPTPIAEKPLDHCFQLDPVDRIVETMLIDQQKNLSLVVWQQTGLKGYNFIQVYTPPDRKSIAIEPMSCAPDAFNNKKGLLILNPEEEVEFLFGIRLE